MIYAETKDFTSQVCDGNTKEATDLLKELRSHIIETFNKLNTSSSLTKKIIIAELHKLSGAAGLMSLKTLNEYLICQQKHVDGIKIELNKDYLLEIEHNCTRLVDDYISVVNTDTNSLNCG